MGHVALEIVKAVTFSVERLTNLLELRLIDMDCHLATNSQRHPWFLLSI